MDTSLRCFYSVPDRGAKYCDERVCVSCVCLCVRVCVCVCVCLHALITFGTSECSQPIEQKQAGDSKYNNSDRKLAMSANGYAAITGIRALLIAD